MPFILNFSKIVMLLGTLTLSGLSYGASESGAGERDQNRNRESPLIAKFIQHLFVETENLDGIGTENLDRMERLYHELEKRKKVDHFETPKTPQEFIETFYQYSAIMFSADEIPHDWTRSQLTRLSEKVQEDCPSSFLNAGLIKEIREKICILVSKDHIIKEIHRIAESMQIDDPLVFLDPYMYEIFLYVDESIARGRRIFSPEEKRLEDFIGRGQDLLYDMVEYLLIESSHIEEMDDFLKDEVLILVQKTLRSVYSHLDPKSREQEESTFPMEEEFQFHLFHFRRGQEIYNSILKKAQAQGIEFPFRESFQKKVEEYIFSILRKISVESRSGGGYTLHEHSDESDMIALIKSEKTYQNMLNRKEKKLASLTLKTKASEERRAREEAFAPKKQANGLMESRSQEENLLSEKGRKIRDEAKKIREQMRTLSPKEPLYQALRKRKAQLKRLWEGVVKEFDAKTRVSPPSLWRQSSFPLEDSDDDEESFELLLAHLKEKTEDPTSPFSRESSWSPCSSAEGRWSPRTPSPLTLNKRGSKDSPLQSSPSSAEEALRDFWQRRGTLTAGERTQYSLLAQEVTKLDKLIRLTKKYLKQNGWRMQQTSVPEPLQDLYTQILEDIQRSPHRKKVLFVDGLVKKIRASFQ